MGNKEARGNLALKIVLGIPFAIIGILFLILFLLCLVGNILEGFFKIF